MSRLRPSRPTRTAFAKTAARAFAGAMLLSLPAWSGCMHPSPGDSARIGPFFTPTNVVGEAQLPAGLRRVVLLPVAGGAIAGAESAAALDPVFVAELQKQNRFEVVPLTREELLQRYRAEELLSTASLPHDFAGRLRRDFAADGVMFVDVTAYKPFRPLLLGVRAKLATTGEPVRILWSFDNVFSADNPAVANSARRRFLDAERGGVPADLTRSVLQSPSQFASYVAGATFATLPPVYVPPPAAETR